jgi:hypothetical protein
MIKLGLKNTLVEFLSCFKPKKAKEYSCKVISILFLNSTGYSDSSQSAVTQLTWNQITY